MNKKTKEIKSSSLRVWHIPQVPGKPFYVDVSTPKEAKKILNILADYDIFQFENKIKPDYSNAAGLEVCEDGVWGEWYNEEGDDIDSASVEKAERD